MTAALAMGAFEVPTAALNAGNRTVTSTSAFSPGISYILNAIYAPSGPLAGNWTDSADSVITVSTTAPAQP